MLACNTQHTYLGVMPHDHLSIHVTNVANKATRILNFLKHHLSKCSSNIKPSVYLLMHGSSMMEYACVVWDPHYQSQVLVLEKVQKHTARWVLSDYSYHCSVSSMLEQLNWLPLAKRRKQQSSIKYCMEKLAYSYLIVTILPTNTSGMQHHPFHQIVPPTNTTSHGSQLYDKLLSQNHPRMEFTATATG